VNNYINNGVAAGKLGVGIDFEGCMWTNHSGLWQPRQSWPTNDVATSTGLKYNQIINNYYQTNAYHWDTVAQAAYLSITNANPANDAFISYDDQTTCQTKISYARNRGLGGS